MLTLRNLGRTFGRDPLSVFGILVVILSILAAVMAPVIALHHPETPNLAAMLVRPGPEYWLGTDNTGLDIFSRIVYALRVDLGIALTATIASILIGVPLGICAGYFGGRKGLLGTASEILLRVTDVAQAFPVFIVAMVLVAVLGPKAINVIIAITFVFTPMFLRLSRGEALFLRNKTYVEAARCTGANEWYIAIRHVLPNALGPVIAQTSVTVGFAMLLTAGLSFVGAGVRVPTPELGSMIAIGSTNIITGQWWPSLFPGIALGLTVFGFAVIGEGLTRYLSPNNRR